MIGVPRNPISKTSQGNCDLVRRTIQVSEFVRNWPIAAQPCRSTARRNDRNRTCVNLASDLNVIAPPHHSTRPTHPPAPPPPLPSRRDVSYPNRMLSERHRLSHRARVADGSCGGDTSASLSGGFPDTGAPRSVPEWHSCLPSAVKLDRRGRGAGYGGSS
jgi:hypothetical protein